MHRLPAAGIACLVFATAGCQPTAPPATGRAGQAAAPTTTAPSPAAADGVDYRCADGSTVHVRYSDSHAEVDWPDGRAVSLPRAESASAGGGDVYVGDTVSLQRDGMRLQLYGGQSTALACERHAP